MVNSTNVLNFVLSRLLEKFENSLKKKKTLDPIKTNRVSNEALLSQCLEVGICYISLKAWQILQKPSYQNPSNSILVSGEKKPLLR